MMLKKVLKLFLFLVLVWIILLLTILRQFKKGTMGILDDTKVHHSVLYKKTRYGITNASISGFDAWTMLDFNSPTLSFQDKVAAVSALNSPPGSNGTSVAVNLILKGSVRALVVKGWKSHAFNEFVSDVIPLNRTLPDVRDQRCKSIVYPNNLPTASVIICFYNEAWSTLLRTVHSVINRSPKDLLKEVILVDDFSTMLHLKSRLESYVHALPKVRLIRTGRREGLIRARLLGAKEAVSPTVVFLDSHCECAEGWLEPLLERISSDPKAVVSPIVDHISDSTFEYVAQNIDDLRIGGFTWDLQFKWIKIPHATAIQRSGIISPVKTPMISGGLFAISKTFFEELGYYDEELEIWGGDNLEISFKVWMCGGSLEIVPCSHVGHVFRRRFPYKVEKKQTQTNLVRLAEVWMDDYAKYFYARINYKKGKYGNINKRKELRKKLNCKSFEWYLKNIYPEMEIPDNQVASGQIFNVYKSGYCLDGTNNMQLATEDVKIARCHFEGGNQYWVYSSDGELKKDDMCLDYLFNTVILFRCKRSASQIWLYDPMTQNIRHMKNQKCLAAKRSSADILKIVLETCSTKDEQKWVLENFVVDRLTPELKSYAKINMRL